LERKIPDEIEEETLSATESANNDAEGCPFIADAIKVLEQGRDFGLAANLD
jgi:hypothetical protein